jgi:hypothetical protein
MRSIVLLLLIGFITSAQAQTGAVSPTASPWQVKGVTVVLSGTTGFSRDMALEQAARQALLQVLQNPLGLSAAEAATKARAVGEAMRFVSRYQIVQEAVLPSYSLKADLTLNESMLRRNFGSNFGGVVAPVAVSATAAVAASATANPATVGNARGYIVRVPEPSATGQDRARRALAALPETRVTYRLISVQGIELNVRSAQPEQALRNALAGWQIEIRPAEAEAKLDAIELAKPELVANEPKAALPPTPPASRRPAWLPDLW